MATAYTYRDVVENWKHFVVDRSGFESRSSGWSDKAILDQFLLLRSTVFRQLMLSGADIGEQNLQNLDCIQLEEVPRSSCPCAPPSGCKWLKSVKVLPKYIDIISVNTVDGGEIFSYLEWDKIKYRTTYSRSNNQSKNYYTVRTSGADTHLYILTDKMLKIVSATLLLEDPYCAIEFPKCCEEPSSADLEKICNPWDTPFLMDSALISQIFNIAWQTLPQLRNAAGPDLFNDSIDNTKGDLNLKI